MSKLDKDQVLADYTAAYQQRHGTKPTIEANAGWYSVNGGKNMRLAQLAEEASALSAEAGNAATKTAKPKAAPAKKAAAKPVATTPPASVKIVSSNKDGLTAKELWLQRLEEQPTLSRLPRGYDS